MSVSFPFTVNGRGGGFGRIFITRAPLPHPKTYFTLSDPKHNFGQAWMIDSKLEHDADTYTSIFSALSIVGNGSQIVVNVSLPPPFDDGPLAGASCGLAAFLATLGIVTDVAVTGYVAGFGTISCDLPIFRIDNVLAKIELARSCGRKLIVPYQEEIYDLVVSDKIWSFRHVCRYNRSPRKVQAPLWSNIGCADDISSISYVLSQLDPDISPLMFIGQQIQSGRRTQL